MTTQPLRVGILEDGEHEGAAGDSVYQRMAKDMQLAIDVLHAEGRLDRPVEFVHEHGLGLPGGTAHAVEQAFARLVDAGVLVIAGPAIGDNAIVATPLADRYRVPAINWSASERARGDWMFHLQVGSHEDESILLARHLRDRGARRVGVVFDRSPIGRRHVAFFEQECEIIDLRIGAREPIAPLAERADHQVAAVREAGVDALVYLGLGWAGREVARARTAADWEVTTVMNAAGMRGADPEFARDIDGWIYPDMHSDANAVLAGVRKRTGDARRYAASLAFGYDMGQLVAEGLARSDEYSREGVRSGLERVKVIPAAEGKDGTLLGFGRFDRGALKGDYLVLRQWRDGESVELT